MITKELKNQDVSNRSIWFIRIMIFSSLFAFLYNACGDSSGRPNPDSGVSLGENAKEGIDNREEFKEKLVETLKFDVFPTYDTRKMCNSLGCDAMQLFVIFTNVVFQIKSGFKYKIQAILNGCLLVPYEKVYQGKEKKLIFSMGELGWKKAEHCDGSFQIIELYLDPDERSVGIRVHGVRNPRNDAVELELQVFAEETSILKIRKVLKGFEEYRPNGVGCGPVCYFMNQTVSVSDETSSEQSSKE